jgi:hypothetical protein
VNNVDYLKPEHTTNKINDPTSIQVLKIIKVVAKLSIFCCPYVLLNTALTTNKKVFQTRAGVYNDM